MEKVEKMKDNIATGENRMEKIMKVNVMEVKGIMVEGEKCMVEGEKCIENIMEMEGIQKVEGMKYMEDIMEMEGIQKAEEITGLYEQTDDTIHRGEDPVEMPQRQSLPSDDNKQKKKHTPAEDTNELDKGSAGQGNSFGCPDPDNPLGKEFEPPDIQE